MIQANELRIGNLLNYQTAEGDVVTLTTDFGAIQWATEDSKGFNLVHSPIPITEEWLVKLGFEKRDDIYRMFKYFVEFRNFDSVGKKILFGCFQFNQIYIMQHITLQYVHALQNLYFALTGEELTIK